MKKLNFIYSLLLFLSLPSIANANNELNDSTLDVRLNLESTGNSNLPTPGSGHRIPPYLVCSINFQTNSIEVNCLEESDIISYEIWNLERSYCLYVSNDSESFVEELSRRGDVAIILRTEDMIGIGYITQ